MSTPPNSLLATSNIRSNCAHSVTSVFRKTARGVVPTSWYRSSSFCASGRRDRSAMRTLQPRERRRAAKEKFMPLW